MKFKNTVTKYKTEITTVLIYIVYLLIIPLVLRLSIPCLKSENEIAYTYSECNIQLVLDRLIIIILIGFVITTLSYFLYKGKDMVKQFVVVSLFLLFLSVAAYYIYLTPITSKAYNNPVILTPTEEFKDLELNIQ